jgi:hypothetical protein
MLNSYDKSQELSNPNELSNEEIKLDFPETCTCPLYQSDYRYFYMCSHGNIVTVCNECGTIYDPKYEAGLSNDKHKLDISTCFKENYRPATMKCLEDAGLKSLVNTFGLLEDE